MEKNIFYHDKEGRLVQVLSQAVMRESGRPVVLYQELFGSYLRKVEFRDIFLDSMRVFDGEFPQGADLVSKNQVKDSGEKKAFGTAENAKTVHAMEAESTEGTDGTERGTPQELLMAFLDAQTYSEKLEVLYQMKDCVTDYLIDTIALSLDMEIPQGVLEDRYQKLIRSLQTVIKYETNRLR